MFSLLPLRTSYAIHVPQYERLIIAFGAPYKGMYPGLPVEWVEKFEHLLSRPCWSRAEVSTDFSRYRYVWELPPGDKAEWYFADTPRPPTAWTLKCFREELHEVPVSQAIEGAYHPWSPSGPST
jgi:hypothetical protein